MRSSISLSDRSVRSRAREVERLPHRELRVDDVVLRHVAHLLPEQVVGPIEVGAVEQHLSVRGRRVAVQRFQERRLAGAGRAHQRDQLRRVDGQRNRIEQPVAVGVFTVTSTAWIETLPG